MGRTGSVALPMVTSCAGGRPMFEIHRREALGLTVPDKLLAPADEVIE
jgi:hypothetical protein